MKVVDLTKWKTDDNPRFELEFIEYEVITHLMLRETNNERAFNRLVLEVIGATKMMSK